MKYGIKLLLGTFIITSVTVNFASILARYVFQAPIHWAEDVITYLMMWSVFIGAAVVVYDERHLNMDLLYTIFPLKWKAALRIISSVGMVIVLCIVIPQSWEIASMIFTTDQRTAVSGFPLIVPHSALLVGFSLMAVAALYRVFTSIRDFRSARADPQRRAAGQPVESER
ncbi:MAG: TRAP transporter small permease [Burkholderiaceae bacterium]